MRTTCLDENVDSGNEDEGMLALGKQTFAINSGLIYGKCRVLVDFRSCGGTLMRSQNMKER